METRDKSCPFEHNSIFWKGHPGHFIIKITFCGIWDFMTLPRNLHSKQKRYLGKILSENMKMRLIDLMKCKRSLV